MRRLLSVTVALTLLALPAALARAATDTEGKTTLQQPIRGPNGPGYAGPGLGPPLHALRRGGSTGPGAGGGGPGPPLRLGVRGGGTAKPQAGRERRRSSLLYFGQMTD